MSGASFVKMCLVKQKIQYAVNSDLIVIPQFNLIFPFFCPPENVIKCIKNALNSYSD